MAFCVDFEVEQLSKGEFLVKGKKQGIGYVIFRRKQLKFSDERQRSQGMCHDIKRDIQIEFDKKYTQLTLMFRL